MFYNTISRTACLAKNARQTTALLRMEGFADGPLTEAASADALWCNIEFVRRVMRSFAGHRKLCAVSGLGLDPKSDKARGIARNADMQLRLAHDAGHPLIRIVADYLLTTEFRAVARRDRSATAPLKANQVRHQAFMTMARKLEQSTTLRRCFESRGCRRGIGILLTACCQAALHATHQTSTMATTDERVRRFGYEIHITLQTIGPGQCDRAQGPLPGRVLGVSLLAHESGAEAHQFEAWPLVDI